MQHDSFVLLAFGFSNLAMLGWLAAAAAPLAIHLWSRHRYREAPWAAMQFLLAAMKKNARRLLLQQWLLLAIRTLIITLVVLAVAEPYGQQLLAGATGAPVHRVIVIDGSYSMSYQTGRITNFDVAKRLASEMVSKSQPGDAFTVILMASQPRVVVGFEVLDHAAVAARIDAISLTQSGTDLAGTLRLVGEAVSGNSLYAAPSRKEVYFLTDLQKKTWGGSTEGVQATGVKASFDTKPAIASIAKLASLIVVDVGQIAASNLAVTDLSTSASVVVIHRDTALDATIRNFGSAAFAGCRVELLIDGIGAGEKTVDVSAGGTTSVHFVKQFSTAVDHTVTVRASGDQLAVDNSRSLVVPVKTEIRVLCVAGRDGAAKYLASALDPTPGGDSIIQPKIITEGELAETSLTDCDCVFLCNVAQLSAGEAERLFRYTEAGGGLVMFLGDRVMPATYNAFGRQGDSAESPSLLPVLIGSVVSQSQNGIDPLNYRHLIVAPFRGRERAGLLTTPVNRYFRLGVSARRSGVEVAAALPGGDPFIVTAPLGRGQTVVVATDGSLSSIDRASGEAWTIWPTWPSFLPLVRELLTFASCGQKTQWQQSVGTPIKGSIDARWSASASHDNLQIVRPDGQTASVSTHSSPTGLEWSYAETDASGIYCVRERSQGRTQQIAVNVDVAESDLSRIDPGRLPPGVIVSYEGQRNSNSSALEVTSPSTWNVSILWSVLALMFAESWMAWQFGRGAL